MTTLADIWPLPDDASTFASRVDTLYFFIIGTTVAVSTLVAVLVIYFAIRYRRRSEDEIPVSIVGSHALEIAWSSIPLCIVMVMFGWSAWLYVDMSTAPADALEVYVIGKQWMWKSQHPDGQREINELHVPVGKPVKLTMTSEDVIHSFFVPDFRTKQDVIPGRYTSLWFQATKPGRFRIYCAEYCGTDHSKMVGWVVASEPSEHQQWLSSRADLSLALRGRALFLKYQCVTCHSSDSQAKAPSLEEIYLKPVRLADGKSIVADESYLRESIQNPRAKVVAGFEPIMPAYQGRLEKDREEQDLLELLAYVKALKKGETPNRNEYSTAPESNPKATEAKPYEPK